MSGDATGDPAGDSIGDPAPISQEPYLAMSDSGPVLRLPAAMREALEAYAPEFRPWRLEEYEVEAAAHAGPPERLPLFGTIGDFNADGVRDVALQGHDAAQEYFVVLLSDGAVFRAVELYRQPYHPDPDGPGRAAYLRRAPPGKVDVPPMLESLEGPAPELVGDGIVEVFEGQASTLYYWKDGRFVRYITGD
ncbi:MAG TPA: hypothetical protein VF188_00880 [Longimicrobiales bacterium]